MPQAGSTHSSKYTHWIWSSVWRVWSFKSKSERNTLYWTCCGKKCEWNHLISTLKSKNINEADRLTVTTQRYRNDIGGGCLGGGGIVKHCSVAVGPNKCQPFPFSVPTHHPCTTVTHTMRPCVDLSLISFLLNNKGNKVLTDLLKRCIGKIFKGQKIVSRYIKANLYSPARKKYIRVRQVTIPCEVGKQGCAWLTDMDTGV